MLGKPEEVGKESQLLNQLFGTNKIQLLFLFHSVVQKAA